MALLFWVIGMTSFSEAERPSRGLTSYLNTWMTIHLSCTKITLIFKVISPWNFFIHHSKCQAKVHKTKAKRSTEMSQEFKKNLSIFRISAEDWKHFKHLYLRNKDITILSSESKNLIQIPLWVLFPVLTIYC